ncbi:STAS domain-containing protein [Nocardioides sp. CPCC 206347]|uniref:STAS domain-containing protein n=1 Tax=unclassified Nocardioides TaxID=2615069 RepID=UPI003617F3EB
MTEVLLLTTRPDTGYEVTLADGDPRCATIRVRGDLDLAAREWLADVLHRQRETGRVVVRLDLSAVVFMDSACLGLLVREHPRFLAVDGLLALTDVGPRITRLLTDAHPDRPVFVLQTTPDPPCDDTGTPLARDPVMRAILRARDLFHRASTISPG